MIDRALGLVAGLLNSHLSARYGVQDDLIVLSPLTDAEGKPAADARNRLVLFLTNISEDATPRSRQHRSGEQVSRRNPVHLDIYFIVASAYEAETYEEGLKLMSAALMFFYAVGAIAAPYVTSVLIAGYGPAALFMFISAGHLLLVVFGLARMRVRSAPEDRTRYVYAPRTSFTIGKLLGRSRDR